MRHSWALTLAAALAVGAAPAGAQHETARESVPLTRMRGGASAFTSYSGMTDSARLVVRDSVAWQELWRRINKPFLPAPATPEIDFAAEMIVVAALGARPSAGHDIVIEGAAQDSAGIEGMVRRSEPAPGCPVAPAVTRPVDFARMRADRRAVRVRERQVVVPCSRP